MKFLIGTLIMLTLMMSSALAMNLVTSNSIFYDITVEQGYSGPVIYNLTKMFNYSFEWTFQPQISWTTRDENVIYNLDVTAEGIGGVFFTGLQTGILIDNNTWYQYNLQISIPANTPAGTYPFEIDGTVCDKTQTGTIGLCLAGGENGNIIVTEKPKPVCLENWKCTAWSKCINKKQTRTCNDLNRCRTTLNKPATTQSCKIVNSR